MWKLKFLLLFSIIPREFNFFLGSLLLTPFKLYLIFLFTTVFINSFIRPSFKWGIHDILALLVSLWPSIALAINSDLSKAFESGGIIFLELFVPYFLARQQIKTLEQLQDFTKFILVLIVVLTIPAIPEAISGRHFIHEFFSALTGNYFFAGNGARLGIWRSYSFTDHPIILGSLCSLGIMFSFYFVQRHSKYVFYGIISLVGVICSVSSAPLLSVISQFGMILWSRIFKGIKSKWFILTIVLILSYIFVDIFSDRDPIRVLLSYLLFSEHNGFVRYYMWVYSFFLINQSLFSALFGYGFSIEMFDLIENPFFSNLMKSTIDSFWLVNLLRYGWVMFILWFLFISSCVYQNRYIFRNSDWKVRKILEAWFIVMISFSIISFTVHFWGSTASTFLIILACGTASIKPKQKVGS